MKYEQKYVCRHQAALVLVLVLNYQKVISYSSKRYIYWKHQTESLSYIILQLKGNMYYKHNISNWGGRGAGAVGYLRNRGPKLATRRMCGVT